jgi:pimeloyl-ACP methyl ester carboxylesterase
MVGFLQLPVVWVVHPCHYVLSHRYVLDTNEELSAFDSVLLEHQARFALACLRHLAAAYNLRPRGAANATAGGPAGAAATGGGVLLFGHSMGGVVARLLLLEAWRDPELGPGSVSLLVTLSSPQAASPVMLHPAMGRLYARLGARPLPVGVPVVSINGGARDVQVCSGAGQSHRLIVIMAPCCIRVQRQWARFLSLMLSRPPKAWTGRIQSDANPCASRPRIRHALTTLVR